MTAEARNAVTNDVVRDLLTDPKIFPDLPPGLADDAEFVLDSLGLVWLFHLLELRYELVIEPDDEQLAAFTSIRRITEYLAGRRP